MAQTLEIKKGPNEVIRPRGVGVLLLSLRRFDLTPA
jgi:hypothetical protein